LSVFSRLKISDALRWVFGSFITVFFPIPDKHIVARIFDYDNIPTPPFFVDGLFFRGKDGFSNTVLRVRAVAQKEKKTP